MKRYADELDGIVQRFDSALIALGAKVRTEVVVPACRRHGLRFISGNWDFYFAKGEATCGCVNDPWHAKLSKPARRTVEPILELLRSEISHGQYLGYFVEGTELGQHPRPRRSDGPVPSRRREQAEAPADAGRWEPRRHEEP